MSLMPNGGLAFMRGLVRNLSPIAILVTCVVLLWPHIAALDTAELSRHWASISTMQWALAGVFTLISFWAVSKYDILAHRQLRTDIEPSAAQRSGLTAIAIAQTTGFGLVTAGLVRWRMLKGFGPGVAAQITGFVSLMFLAALMGICALMCLILPVPSGFSIAAMLVLGCLAGLVTMAVCRPRLKWRGHIIELPSLRVMMSATGWAALDVCAAAGAFYVLIPPEAAPELLAFLPAFCLALAAGLFTGTPGGVGPFEMTLIALTAAGTPAATDLAVLVVAVFGFRLVYFAAPASLALALVILPRPNLVLWQDPPPPDLSDAPRAETAVIAQTGGRIERIGPLHSAVWQTGQALVSLFDPFGPRVGTGFFSQLKVRATATNRLACLYKCSARTASAARRAGWSTLHLADDAIIDLLDFSLECPARARLRRKLRKAKKGGALIRPLAARDIPALPAIDATWQETHGTARGGTMGRFCPSYLDAQAVFVAETDGKVTAFISFHVNAQEWALDMMRYGADLPDGTMQVMVIAAIDAARHNGARTLSLSAVPACPDPESAFWRWAAMQLVARSGGKGLRQFKSAFAPRWKPLYAAAPNRLALTICLADIAREVVLPAPLTSTVQNIRRANVTYIHNNDEDYEVASSSVA